MSSAVGLISGGLDSTVVAAHMEANFESSYYLFCDYGQKTLDRETDAFNALCDYYQPEGAEIVDMRWMRQLGSSALFEAETTLNAENSKREYVPFRNACLLSAGVALAETVEADALLIGSTGGDRTCPDNSPEFLEAFQRVIEEGTMSDQQISLIAPLVTLDKKGVVQLGLELGAPFNLSWSCHNNQGATACGGCTNCLARRQAFTDLDLVDPVAYE